MQVHLKRFILNTYMFFLSVMLFLEWCHPQAPPPATFQPSCSPSPYSTLCLVCNSHLGLHNTSSLSGSHTIFLWSKYIFCVLYYLKQLSHKSRLWQQNIIWKKQCTEYWVNNKKNAYGRHRLSRRVRIVATVQ